MTFLNPLVLLGLAAAAVPVLLHLINLRRPRRVDFSSLTFVRELQQSAMQRVRIKQWLLLALRVGALIALVTAFARPTLTGEWAGAGGTRGPASIGIVVDNSLSMTMRDGRGVYLEQARQQAVEIAGALQQDDELFITTTGASAPPARHATGGPAREAIEAIEAVPGARSAVPAAVAAARRLSEDARHESRVLYLLTDLQRSTFADTAAAAWPEDVRPVLLPLGERAHPNVAVTGVQVESRIVEAGRPVRLQATLENFGPEAISPYSASLYLEDTRVAQATTELLPQQATTVQFTATPRERGWLRGRVEIEDDGFAADNVRHFALHVPRERRVLIVRGAGQRTDFLELALSPELAREGPALAAEVVGEDRLAGAALSAYDAVVLAGPQRLSSGVRSALAQYVEEGGGLLFFPRPEAPEADYAALFRQLGGGETAGYTGALGREQSVAAFDRVDVEHPLFEGVFDDARGGDRVEQPAIYYALNYVPQSGAEHTLIQLSSGYPFLQELVHGRGRALVLAVAPTPQWSDLPVRGLFVPLVYRSLQYLSASEAVSGEQVAAGAVETLRIGGVDGAEPLRLIGPDGEEQIPEQQVRRGAVLVTLDPPLQALGLYDVRAGETLVRRIAAHVDRRESDLRALDAEQGARHFADATGRDVQLLEANEGGAAGLAEALRAEQMGVEVWNVFLMLALLFLVAEMFVARYWTPEEAS